MSQMASFKSGFLKQSSWKGLARKHLVQTLFMDELKPSTIPYVIFCDIFVSDKPKFSLEEAIVLLNLQSIETILTRRNIIPDEQFGRFEIRLSTFLNNVKFVDPRILRLCNCEKASR